MRKILLAVFLLNALNNSAQTKTAAIIGLSSSKTTVSYIGKTPAVVNDDGRCLADFSKNYNDSLGFVSLKFKIDSVLTLMGFRLLPEDSILKTENYREISKKISGPMRYADKPSLKILASGYGYTEPSGFGSLAYLKEYFKMNPKPDIVIDAMVDFNINIATDSKTQKDKVNVVCVLYFKSFTENNKKPFKFRVNYTHPHNIAVKVAKNCWGFEIIEDISQYKKEALKEALKLIDEDLKKEIEDVNKFYSAK